MYLCLRTPVQKNGRYMHNLLPHRIDNSKEEIVTPVSEAIRSQTPSSGHRSATKYNCVTDIVRRAQMRERPVGLEPVLIRLSARIKRVVI
jgi:hypothetical protein